MNELLSILSQFKYNNELLKIVSKKRISSNFILITILVWQVMPNTCINIIRLKKPSKIIEIGCGYSTLMAQKAIQANRHENNDYVCEHICIEPYEMPWLEQLNIIVVRKKVEDLSVEFFRQLQANDILFIDSSHMIRPQGDVLFEFLEVLPPLSSGVMVHVHDIFTPKDYLTE